MFSQQTPSFSGNRAVATVYVQLDPIAPVGRELQIKLKAASEGRIMRGSIAGTVDDLDHLHNLGECWNGYDVAAPNPEAIAQAKEWIYLFYLDSGDAGGTWLQPHVAANEDGDVTFEWWHRKKKLTVYVTPHEAWYIKVSGPSTVNEMEDGDATTEASRKSAWRWLTEN